MMENRRKSIQDMIDRYDENHFTTFLKGKKVVIVGPDTNLIGKKLGKSIDKYDVVIRHNTVLQYLPFDRRTSIDFGSRTDILYLSPQCVKNYSSNRGILNRINRGDIKFIVYQNGNRDYQYLTGEYCYPDELFMLKKYLNRLKISTHYSHHTTRLLTDLMNSIRDQDKKSLVPRTGFISIFDAMIHQAKEVKVLGMSFYQGGGHAFRKEVQKALRPRRNATGDHSPHDSDIELLLMRQLMGMYPNIFKISLSNGDKLVPITHKMEIEETETSIKLNGPKSYSSASFSTATAGAPPKMILPNLPLDLSQEDDLFMIEKEEQPLLLPPPKVSAGNILHGINFDGQLHYCLCGKACYGHEEKTDDEKNDEKTVDEKNDEKNDQDKLNHPIHS